MSGVAVTIQLLLADGPVGEFVAADNVVAGTIPAGTKGCAIGVESISEPPDNELAPDDWIFVRERVQATIIAPAYEQAHDLLKAVKRACSNKFPAVDGLRNVAVTPAGGGPEGIHIATLSPSRTYDFFVSYEEPA